MNKSFTYQKKKKIDILIDKFHTHVVGLEFMAYIYILIGKFHMHVVGVEPMTSPSNQLSWEKGSASWAIAYSSLAGVFWR